ncbi:DUF192 domain-containing protein [Candidatus Daviesbacteria bacterium]|nr:DUF192 domain-containing protein [Candidatus Daviesbacteria bacterium]
MKKAISIVNTTRSTVITKNAFWAKSFWRKSVGLINKPKGTSLILKTRFGIHTIGIRYPIDVLILDKNYQVLEIKQNLQPNRFFFWNPIYTLVAELPWGSIRISRTIIGDFIKIK